jgi:ABC-type glycerol-3-phosphate transport system substrate-binding protein
MVEIKFSVMEGSPGDANNLLPLLEAFEKQYHIHVNLTGVTWAQGWAEIAKFAIHGRGPDVSSIGTTWIASLAAMESLRPFTDQQVRAVGGADAFFESSWRAGFLPNSPTPWAIPWLGDPTVIYYWKDTLEKAGIHDFEAAFASNEAVAETLATLQKSGCTYPLALTTTNLSMTLHETAHWIWSAGGDFISPDNRQIAFNQPAAMQGWKNYFSLRRYVSPASATAVSAGDLFGAGEAAVMFGGTWQGIVGRQINPGWNERLGIAQVPGPAYMGGASFVIWEYSLHNYEAFELVRFLSSQPTRIPAAPHDHQLPTRREALYMPSLEKDIFHHAYVQALQNGRDFPSIRLWGAVEDKLVLEISRIWAELFANPDADLDTILCKHLDPLAQRLNVVLGN